MNKTTVGISGGLAALVAVCCSGHLLLLLGLPLLATLTGKAWLIALTAAVALVAIGTFLWRRRGRCGDRSCAAQPPAAADRPLG